MPIDPAQRNQIEQDAITAAWEAVRRAACNDDIIGTDADGHNDLLSRMAAVLVTHDIRRYCHYEVDRNPGHHPQHRGQAPCNCPRGWPARP